MYCGVMRSSDLCDLAGVSGWCGAVAREMPSRVQPAGEGEWEREGVIN